MSRRIIGSVALVLVLAGGCAGRVPIVEHHTLDLRAGLLEKVAIVPFYPVKGFDGGAGEGAVSGKEAGDLVARFVSEALAAEGIDTIAPSDVALGFEGAGKVLPRQDPLSTAKLMSSQFGASAVAVGSVRRYRERGGEAIGSQRPASVWFEFEIYTAPGGKKIWTVSFDETQKALSSALFQASRYPGGGSRWLSAGELARWGAAHAASELPEALR